MASGQIALFLYRGTSSIFLDSIKANGLLPEEDNDYGVYRKWECPIIFLTSSLSEAKLYAYHKCYHNIILYFMREHSSEAYNHIRSKWGEYKAVGGYPVILKVKIELGTLIENDNPIIDRTEYVSLFPIIPENIEVQEVKESYFEVTKLCMQETINLSVMVVASSLGFSIQSHEKEIIQLSELLAQCKKRWKLIAERENKSK